MNEDTQKAATRRISIIKGQIDGLQRMIQQDAYCMDILTQSLAIQKSLASLNKVVLKGHITTHVTDMLSSDDDSMHQKAVDELLHLYELNNVRGK